MFLWCGAGSLRPAPWAGLPCLRYGDMRVTRDRELGAPKLAHARLLSCLTEHETMV